MRQFPEEFEEGGALENDRLSALAPQARRAVHPYRDRRDALIERRRVLARELRDTERAMQRRERVLRHLEVIDDELDDHRVPHLDAIAIETPCAARWEDMRGDDVVRRCDRCERDVYDLSRMTTDEIEAFLARASQTPGVRLRRRRDGRVATGDCPVEKPSAWMRTARLVTAGALFGVSAVVGAALTIMAVAPIHWKSPPIQVHPVARPAAHVATHALQSSDLEPDDALTTARLAPASPPTERDDLDRHIRWIAPQAWEIDRAFLSEFLESQPALMRSGRLIPHERDGRIVGVKIYGIRRLSVLGRLGLQNGDLLIDANGRSLSSPDSALELYSSLRTPDALFLRLERRGEERVHVYRITP